MLFADTVVQVDAASLVTALAAFGGAVGGGFVAAAKIIKSAMSDLQAAMKAMHEDNRKDQAELFRTMNDQWGVLVGLRKSANQIEKKLNGEP